MPQSNPTRPDTPSCFANHLGIWLCEAMWLCGAVDQIRAGLSPDFGGGSETVITPDGIAIFAIDGPMMKPRSKFGGTSSLALRRALRQATNDPSVKGGMLVIDSPGGHVAGQMDLVDDIQRFQASKPMHAHITDLGASAAYWAASATSRITAGNKTTQVGSIGTRLVVWDMSQAFERDGVEVVEIASGPYKGTGEPGTAITPEQRAYLTEMVEDINSHFLAAVQAGRGLDDEALAAVSDGRVFVADKAKKLGLIDAVQPFDAAMAALVRETKRRKGMRMTQEDAALFAAAETDYAQTPEPIVGVIPGGLSLTQADVDAAREEGKTEGYTQGFTAGYASARDVVDLCTIAGRPAKAAALLKDNIEPAAARHILNEIRVQEQEVIQSHVDPVPTATPSRTGLTLAGAYESYNKAFGFSR